MADGIDKDIQALFSGEAVDSPSKLHVDLPIKGKYVPITKETVHYIVAAIVTNDHQEVLMMQEAKESCRGKWYLPAGRVEPNETLEQAVKREVLEETGIEFQPTSLGVVEIQSGVWYRFTFMGYVTGGKLKTLAEQDKESLQARWCMADSIDKANSQLPLRGSDVVPLVRTVMVYHQTEATHRHQSLLPQLVPHKRLLLRIVLVQPCGSELYVLTLIGNGGGEHLPMGEMSHNTSLMTVLRVLLQEALGNHCPTPTLHGILCLEHAGKPARVNDGMCVTLLVSLAPTRGSTDTPPGVSKNFAWHTLKTQSVNENITRRLQKGMTIPLTIH